MILRKEHRILVQGMTGKQGTFWTQAMIDYGATVVAGVNPRKAGTEHLGRPIFASARDAASAAPFDVALMFVPPMGAKAAAIDASEAGAKLIVCLTEHIPAHDVMEMHAAARASGTRIVGPNTAGLVTPGETFAGIMPAFNPKVFQPGRVGVISRSGSLGTLLCLNLVQSGHGISAFYGVGGDPMIGTTPREALEFLDQGCGHRCGRAMRRDRRLGRGGGRGLRERHEEDRGGLHRRTRLAAGQEDGACRRYCVGRSWGLRVEAAGAGGGRRCRRRRAEPGAGASEGGIARPDIQS